MNCPECNAELYYTPELLEDGEIIDCDECDQELQVFLLDGGGIVLDLADDTLLDDIEW